MATTATETVLANKLFKIKDNTTPLINNISFKWPTAEPLNGSTIIDVVGSYQWKNIITSKDIEEVPSLLLTEYVMPYGKWMQIIENLLQNGATDNSKETTNKDPYGMLYSGIATGFSYRLPYLIKPGQSLRGSIRNTWTELSIENVPVLGSIAGTISKVAELATPGYGFETPTGYNKTSKKSITITFPLYNTVDINKTIDNYWLITLLAFQNLKIRTTYLTYIPPRIYEVYSENATGSVYMPAAYVSNYKVDSIGATRHINIEDGAQRVLIPEAYRVSITLEELISESANIMRGAIDFSNRTKVIQLPSEYKGTNSYSFGIKDVLGNVDTDKLQ